MRRIALGAVTEQSPLDAYVLTGVDLTPQFLLLDPRGRLFAVLSSSLLVRQGFEKRYQALRDLEESLTVELLRAMQQKVAHRYDVPIRIRNVHIFDPKSGIARHLGEWALLVNPFPGEVQTAHEQIAVGTRAEHDPELARKVVSGQSRDRLQLRRMHDTDRSGWWLLVPIANLIFAIQDGQPGDNRFGPSPKASVA